MSEESHNRESFINNTMFQAKALNMTNVAYKHSCHTERKRKYPVKNTKELPCKKDNYIEINNQLDCFGSKEPHNDDTNSVILSESERSHSRENIPTNAILRGLNNCSPQEYETKHVIVSDSETIQSIDNQKPLQGKIDSLRESSCPPLEGGEFAYGRRETSPDSEKIERIDTCCRKRNFSSVEQIQDRPKSMISRWGKINCHVKENGNLSLNNFVEDIPLTCTPKVRICSLRIASSPRWGEEFLDAHCKNSRKIAFTEPSRGMSGAKVEQTSAETLSFRCVCERCRLTRGEVGSKRRKVAFTLAEVLITLGIIGVVAAITLPSVVQNYREKEYATKLKRFYSEMENASRLVVEEYGTIDTWGLTYSFVEDENTTQEDMDNKYKSIDLFWERYMKYLGGEKTPPTNMPLYGMDKKSVWSSYSGNHGWYALKDGIVVRTTWLQIYNGCGTNCGDFSVDLNGDKAPNSLGRDIFAFYITNKGILPFGLPSEPNRTFVGNCLKDLKGTHVGYGCTAWVIYNENMDYLHCNGLSWEGKTKCKN